MLSSSHLQQADLPSAPVKGRKKRQRDPAQDAEAPDANGIARPRKKKKKSASGSDLQAPEQPTTPEGTSDTTQKKGKGKGKKKKEKAATTAVVPDNANTNVTTLADTEGGGPTAAEFISALVSAAAPTLHHDPPIPIPLPGTEQIPSGMPPYHLPFPLPHPYLPIPPPPGLHSSHPDQPFSELAFGSHEDIMRSLQDLDMSKIAHALRGLGEAANHAGVQLPQMPVYPVPPHIPQPEAQQQDLSQPHARVQPVPALPNLVIPECRRGSKHKRLIDMDAPGDNGTTPRHAELLATKWLTVGKLAELVKTEGLVYKKGKFSAIEMQQVKDAVERYRVQRMLTMDQLRDDTIFSKDKNKDNAFWSEITCAVPQRPIISVYHFVRRAYNPSQGMGAWTAEEDTALLDAFTRFGPKWEKISPEVGRAASDCRDRHRNHLAGRNTRNTGHWTKEEEEELTKIVTDMTKKQGKDTESEIFWGTVSQRMNGKRGRQQCRIKWFDSLLNQVNNDGERSKWSSRDAFILVHKVDSLNVRDDSEIDWKTLPDPDWIFWSAHVLQRRWLTLKKSVKGYETMTHAEIMEILRIKWQRLPSPPAEIRPKKKYISSETIDDEAIALDDPAN